MFETSQVRAGGRAATGRVTPVSISIAIHTFAVVGVVAASVTSIDFPRRAPDQWMTVQIVRGPGTFSDGSAGNVGLRVTHVLRREAVGWRIVHRHADEQLRLLPISSHLQPDP